MERCVCRTMVETAFTHNFGFHPTGLLREVYVAHLDSKFAARAAGRYDGDASTMKAVEITNWRGAWTFVEACSFVEEHGEADEVADAG